VDTFVSAIKKHYPKAFLHFEDFGLPNARRLLEIYRPQLPCFNDDIQGTGAVTLAAIMSAVWVCKMHLKDVRMLIYGAGSAGTGIADQVRDAIAKISNVEKTEAAKKIWLFDKAGILTNTSDGLTVAQETYTCADSDFADVNRTSLADVIKIVKPHVLVGTSTHHGGFTEAAIKEMTKHVDRPIVLPLSNPTKLIEAEPQDIFTWSEGKALIATGSPFEPVEYNGTKYVVAECNNATVYPGIGLGCVLSRATKLSDTMLVSATHALAAQSPALNDPNLGLLPDVKDVRDISTRVACAVIKQAVEEGLATVDDIPSNDDELKSWVQQQMWDPVYLPLKKVSREGASREAMGQVGSKSRA